jgi:hypothetical protein
MSLRRWVLAAGLVLAVSVVQEARAQGRRGGGGMQPQGVSSLIVVAFEPVQKELALKPEQTEKIKELLADYRTESRAAVSELGIDLRALADLPAEERQKKTAEMAAANKKVRDKFEPKLNEILDKTQQTRAREIAVQFAGVRALHDESVAKELNLTKEQTDKLAAITKEYAGKMRDVPREERAAKMKEINEEQLAKSNEVLTKDQQAQFAKMKGSAFDVSTLRAAGPGGGQRRRRATTNN